MRFLLSVGVLSYVCSAAFGHLLPRDEQCEKPQLNDCSFYDKCLESCYHCGPDGYPIGFGQKYCQKFQWTSPRMSELGQAWITKTMLCLQEHLVPIAAGQQSSCEDIHDVAFKSHPGCYVNSGVCFLPPTDWAVILDTIGFAALFDSAESIKAVLDTVDGCGDFYEWLLKRSVLKVVDKVKEEGEEIWHDLVDWC